jgi:hypothetical protein
VPLQTSIRKHKDKSFVTVYDQPLIKLLYPFSNQQASQFSAKWSNSQNQYFETTQSSPLLVSEIISWLNYFEEEIHSVETTLKSGFKIDSNFSDESFFEIADEKNIELILGEFEKTCSPNFTPNIQLPPVPRTLKTTEI